MKSFVTHTTGGDKYVTTYYVRDPQGNALAVYEWKRGEPSDGALPTVESLTDYYPFGMEMPGRSYTPPTTVSVTRAMRRRACT